MKKLLFVCLGNICRSPAAEGIMQSKISQAGLEDLIYCDSAGTSAYHAGERADARMREHAAKRGFKLLSRSRPFEKTDFEEFDLILCMDQSNLENVKAMDAKKIYSEKIKLITDYLSFIEAEVVPDPYYGGDQGFEFVMDILEESCTNLLKEVRKSL